MLNKFYFTSIVLTLTMFVTGCAQQQSGETISLDEVLNRIGEDTSLVVIDVRTAEELHGPLGKIDKAIHIPLQELTARISEIEKFRDKELAVICRTDNRSSVARNMLKQAGFNVRNVPGGMVHYQSKK